MNNHKIFSLLVVDDNSSNIDLLFHSLDSEYTIYAAKNGVTAIKLAQEKHPDLILLDIAMPGMDGFAVMTQLKADKTTSAIPVIFVTGKATYEDRAKGYHLGAVDYITKPFELLEVKTRIQSQLLLNRNIQRMLLMDNIMNDLNLLVWRYDYKNKQFYSYGTILEILGINTKTNDLFSNEYQSLLNETDRAQRQEICNRIKIDPQDYQITYRIKNKEDETITLMEKGTLSKDEEKTSYGMVIKIG